MPYCYTCSVHAVHDNTDRIKASATSRMRVTAKRN